jgi:hypothetical protein
VQFLASLVFNGARIILKALDVPLQTLVLILQTLQLFLKNTRVMPLLLVGGQSILPEDDMKTHADGKQGCCRGRSTTALMVRPQKPTAHTGKRLCLLT